MKNENEDDEGPAVDMDTFVAEGGLEDSDPNRFFFKVFAHLGTCNACVDFVCGI